MNDKRTVFVWGGLFGVLIAVFLMNNWIKDQLEKSPGPSRQIVRPAVPPENVQASSALDEGLQELAPAEVVPDTDPQEIVQTREQDVEDPNIVYETPLINPILQQ